MSRKPVEAEIGIIGGSGLYELSMLADARSVDVSTPFGPPSGPIVLGELAGRRVAFVSRHGAGHRLSPSEVPAAANIYALRQLGVAEAVAVSAVGSLRAELRPGDLVVQDQLVDLTRGIRRATFFEAGVVAHLPFADPYCARLRPLLVAAARRAQGATVHDSGTYVCIEGPQFSSRAESELYRSWGMDVIGMTAAPEAKLAREAGICLTGLALVTDYDCWRRDEEAVTASMVADTMRRNVVAAQAAIAEFLATAPPAQPCDCHDALDHALLSDLAGAGEGILARLGPIVEKVPR
ncbi:S-methyl-5'-thioadenosine phosphorylase [Solihabitans fulvus]|uniref:S-methyl-5'-thioadenosine phosphorylase n=1 Tax=Solihabitans fulvus TaxID=1892852 RepID=A0A5B2WSC2_9PSEU|nr:S-methyl-5'-thioadenosine phosphorylase [Solihabitans fulvus]KAA2252847.1 S-methyl-5'-thioadenosine phosphorylase [Solihabitans fulvus]